MSAPDPGLGFAPESQRKLKGSAGVVDPPMVPEGDPMTKRVALDTQRRHFGPSYRDLQAIGDQMRLFGVKVDQLDPRT